MKIIGLVGKRRSGKSAAAQIMSKLSEDVVTLSFAAALKHDCAKMLGLTLEKIDKHKEVFRPFLQWYGTEFVRKYLSHPDHWIDELHNRIRDIIEVCEPKKEFIFVVEDVRFLNEAEWVIKSGGVLIKIVRPELPLVEVDNHASETELNQISEDHKIINDGTLAQFEADVIETFKLTIGYHDDPIIYDREN